LLTCNNRWLVPKVTASVLAQSISQNLFHVQQHKIAMYQPLALKRLPEKQYAQPMIEFMSSAFSMKHRDTSLAQLSMLDKLPKSVG